MGALLHEGLRALRAGRPQIGAVLGKGLVAGVICVHPETHEPDGDLAGEIASRLIEKGVLVFAPVGYHGSTVKIAPPLSIAEAAVRDSLAAFGEAVSESLA